LNFASSIEVEFIPNDEAENKIYFHSIFNQSLNYVKNLSGVIYEN